MGHPDLHGFKKLLQEIMNQEPESILSLEEIGYEVEAMKALELVGDRWVL